MKLNIFWATERDCTVLVVGRTQVLVLLSTPNAPSLPCVSSQSALEEGMGTLLGCPDVGWPALVGVTGSWAQVWECWGEDTNWILTYFPSLSLSEDISSGLTESCCTCHAHFSSPCAFLVSVTYCCETEFNQWTPALLINSASCSP